MRRYLIRLSDNKGVMQDWISTNDRNLGALNVSFDITQSALWFSENTQIVIDNLYSRYFKQEFGEEFSGKRIQIEAGFYTTYVGDYAKHYGLILDGIITSTYSRVVGYETQFLINVAPASIQGLENQQFTYKEETSVYDILNNGVQQIYAKKANVNIVVDPNLKQALIPHKLQFAAQNLTQYMQKLSEWCGEAFREGSNTPLINAGKVKVDFGYGLYLSIFSSRGQINITKWDKYTPETKITILDMIAQPQTTGNLHEISVVTPLQARFTLGSIIYLDDGGQTNTSNVLSSSGGSAQLSNEHLNFVGRFKITSNIITGQFRNTDPSSWCNTLILQRMF